ncbi:MULTISPECIES: AraC family transcriptional regulator [Bacillaceae]|uniref:AraC family transcriptional regulator n=1 Tax=Evansella alkalicola TaxID=745819 RepID=A0ABS6K1Z2_9BACI|nr:MULTISPECIES: helix-turn-helix domain-containing protein [Bacillaceae]MBU9723522.1 AraC family transcriptional regulator [Bacillus alkalicola]
MSYLCSLEKALGYIESHLHDDMDLSAIAKEAGYSLYHFHRIFKGIVGDSLKDYIRKRRMTEAAKDLVDTRLPIIDIAIKYGYESREAFSRSFEKVYGKAPSEVRTSKLLYFIREPMDINHLLFEYRLRTEGITPQSLTLPDRYVVGKKWKMTADGSNLQQIPLLWQEWNSKNVWEAIQDKIYPKKVMGICLPSVGVTFNYMIGYEVSGVERVPPEMEVQVLEQSDYAIFRTMGPITETVQKTWDYIYSVWLVKSEYQHTGTHDIEYYYYHQGNLIADLYVPIRGT